MKNDHGQQEFQLERYAELNAASSRTMKEMRAFDNKSPTPSFNA